MFVPMQTFAEPAPVVPIDHFLLKEMRTYCANELFKCKAKTDRLYQEFTSVRQMRDELRELSQQADLSENKKPAVDSMVGKLDH